MCTFNTRSRLRPPTDESASPASTEAWFRGFRAGFLAALLLVVSAMVLLVTVLNHITGMA